jgi:hypothetical protein
VFYELRGDPDYVRRGASFAHCCRCQARWPTQTAATGSMPRTRSERGRR